MAITEPIVFGRLSYDWQGDVVDWGCPNGWALVRLTSGGVGQTPCWKLLHIRAKLRDFAGRVRYKGDHGWWAHADYWVDEWSLIRMVFDEFFGTCGWYHRVSFQVEACIWTMEEGWDVDDQV